MFPMGGSLCFLWEELSVSWEETTPLPVQNMSITPDPYYLQHLLWGGGDILLLPLPVPMFDLVHNAHVIISCRRTAVYPNSILPSNCITNKENRYYNYLTAYYPLSLLPINKFSLHVENYGPKYMVLFYCNPQGTYIDVVAEL